MAVGWVAGRGTGTQIMRASSQEEAGLERIGGPQGRRIDKQGERAESKARTSAGCGAYTNVAAVHLRTVHVDGIP